MIQAKYGDKLLMSSLQGSKPASKSITIIASGVSSLATIAVAGMIVAAAPPLAVLVPTLLGGGISILGNLTAIWGRKRATKRITK